MALGNNPSPIWQGVQKTLLNTAGAVSYTVSTETPAALIFSGKATNRPGETSVVVELFDILAPHLRQASVPVNRVYFDETDELVPSNYARRFVLAYGGSSENIDVVANYDYGKSALVRPVTMDVVRGCPIVASKPYQPAGTIALKRGGSTIASLYNSAARAVNVVFQTSDGIAAGDQLTIAWADGTTTGPFNIREDCALTHVLYYVNAGGGWDALPLRGLVKRTDEFSRETTENFRPLTSPDVPDRRICRVDAGVTWELHTGLLTDDESRVFSANVPNSPQAILFSRAEAGEQFAVEILDTSVPHGLTIATNGRRPVDYTLTVKLAQDRPRL